MNIYIIIIIYTLDIYGVRVCSKDRGTTEKPTLMAPGVAKHCHLIFFRRLKHEQKKQPEYANKTRNFFFIATTEKNPTTTSPNY